MKALVTGAGGLIGRESCLQFANAGYEIIGVDNDMRRYFFGDAASTNGNVDAIKRQLGEGYTHIDADIRSRPAMDYLMRVHQPEVIVHTAAQPSHDWAAKEPHTDFDVNTGGTLNLLEAMRSWCPDSSFIHCSTSKVYGDNPNRLPLDCGLTRVDLAPDHKFYEGITPEMSVDLCTHSLFGVSKLAGDLYVQEYGRNFGLNTVCFRPGCLTGGFHQGAEMHGFLSYLMKCAVIDKPYTVYGYKGFQVRCNIHSSDLVRAFRAYADAPRAGAVYNIGGGRQRSCSVIEAVTLCQEITGTRMKIDWDGPQRTGDHHWWISSNADFERDYPTWRQKFADCYEILQDIHDSNAERWQAEVAENY